jgi:hypothetical protein
MKHEIEHKLIEIKVLSKNEDKVEYNTSENLIQSFIEDWNDRNPEHKLEPEMIEIITHYLRVGYVSGWDDYRLLVDKALYGQSEKMSKHFFVKILQEFENKV